MEKISIKIKAKAVEIFYLRKNFIQKSNMTLRAYGAEPHRKIDLTRFLIFVAKECNIFVTNASQKIDNCGHSINFI